MTVVTPSISLAAPPAHGRVVRSRLRLTRRGRAVVTAAVSLPFVIAALGAALNGGGAVASLDSSPSSFEYVTVGAGESLWQLAEQIAPEADPREVIADVIALNQLPSADVHPGERLAVPAEYAD